MGCYNTTGAILAIHSHMGHCNNTRVVSEWLWQTPYPLLFQCVVAYFNPLVQTVFFCGQAEVIKGERALTPLG